jgi:hypothetical protein
MKKSSFIAALSLMAVTLNLNLVGCSKAENGSHLGEIKKIDKPIQIDSLVINADSTSLRGNFTLVDSTLLFIDQLDCRIFAFSLNDGSLVSTYSGRGQGPNEMVGIMYGHAVNPADTTVWIFDSSYGVYEFNCGTGRVNFKSRLDFGWNKPQKNNYESPSCYNVMQMSDFGVTIDQIDKSTVVLPLSLINRNLDGVKAERYAKGHILGLVDTETLKVKKLIANFPEYYTEKPTPFFEFFDYAVNHKDSLIYVNHAPDSLIYCYNFAGEMVNTIGFEPEGINREYTSSIDATPENFKEDISHVGVNTGLWYDEDENLIFRTSMTDFASGTILMQVYKDNDLIHEVRMPAYFKLLGKYNGKYYGVRFIPVDDGTIAQFVLYSFKLPK